MFYRICCVASGLFTGISVSIITNNAAGWFAGMAVLFGLIGLLEGIRSIMSK